tara:strand:- start:11072 stop:12016 length:945 start_codon:yes stop_codon:yes gene_type:complete
MEIYCIIATLLLILLIILYITKKNGNTEEFKNWSIYPQEVYVTNYYKPITKNIAAHQMTHTIARNKNYYGGYKGTCKDVATCDVQLEPCPELLPSHYQNCQDKFPNCHVYKEHCPEPNKINGVLAPLSDPDFKDDRQRYMCAVCPRTCNTCDRTGGCPWIEENPIPATEETGQIIFPGKTPSCSALQQLENYGYNDSLDTITFTDQQLKESPNARDLEILKAKLLGLKSYEGGDMKSAMEQYLRDKLSEIYKSDAHKKDKDEFIKECKSGKIPPEVIRNNTHYEFNNTCRLLNAQDTRVTYGDYTTPTTSSTSG